MRIIKASGIGQESQCLEERHDILLGPVSYTNKSKAICYHYERDIYTRPAEK
jgi:hypothetical protein